jgi:hypothetical protein
MKARLKNGFLDRGKFVEGGTWITISADEKDKYVKLGFEIDPEEAEKPEEKPEKPDENKPKKRGN